MKMLTSITILAAALTIGSTAAEAAPWCAWFLGYDYSYDCSYYTFEQCQATIHGVGGYCARNVYPEPRPYPPSPYRKRPPRRHD